MFISKGCCTFDIPQVYSFWIEIFRVFLMATPLNHQRGHFNVVRTLLFFLKKICTCQCPHVMRKKPDAWAFFFIKNLKSYFKNSSEMQLFCSKYFLKCQKKRINY
uniref:Uncharacterized protein n=1 Tax=Micrurus lemniscatus lemniscatus TaxID=129467 RepID=A0A2D4J2K5_MICLE